MCVAGESQSVVSVCVLHSSECVCVCVLHSSEYTPFLFEVVFSLSDHDDVQVLLVRLKGGRGGRERRGEGEGRVRGGSEQRFNQQVGFTHCPTSANLLALSYSPCSK